MRLKDIFKATLHESQCSEMIQKEGGKGWVMGGDGWHGGDAIYLVGKGKYRRLTAGRHGEFVDLKGGSSEIFF